MQDWIASN